MTKPERPNVRTRKNPSNKIVYFIDYIDPTNGKRIRSVVGTVKRDAEKKADHAYREMMNRYVGGASQSFNDISLKNLIEIYFQTKLNRIATSSLRRYRTYASNFFDYMSLEFPTNDTASTVSRRQVELFLKYLSDSGKKPKTINGQLSFIKRIFDLAVNDGLIRESKVKSIQKVRDVSNSSIINYWTIEQVELILSVVKSYWRDPLEFLYHTGIRKGELINLTWADVNLNERQPTIIIQGKVGWTPKTKRQRAIPLNPKAVELIKKQTHSSTDKFVFKAKNGGMIHRDKIYRGLQVALKKLGLDGTVHTFRHTFASHLVMKGIGLETVSKLLGHSSIEMTMKYAHLAPDHLRKAVNVLSSE